MGDEAVEMRVIEVFEIQNEFGVLRDFEIGLDVASGGLVKFSRTVNIKIVAGFGGW